MIPSTWIKFFKGLVNYLPHMLMVGGVLLIGFWVWNWTQENERLRTENQSLSIALSLARAQHAKASQQAKEAGERYAADVKTRENSWVAKAKEDEDAMARVEDELRRTRGEFQQRVRDATAKARNRLCANGVQSASASASESGAGKDRGLVGQEDSGRTREFERALGELRDEARRESAKLHSCQARYDALQSDLQAIREGISR